MKPSAWPWLVWRTLTIEIGNWINTARLLLASNTDTPLLEAQILASQIMGRPRAWIVAHPDINITERQENYLQSALHQLLEGKPLPYVIQHWEFYGIDLQISHDVLIPRPETEILVEEAIRWLRTHQNRLFVADVGTGSGCIAISIARYMQNIHIIASDTSIKALRIAKKNVMQYSFAARIHLFQADLLKPFKGPFNLICANLPYIPSDKLKELQVAKHEPLNALDGGPDGLVFIRELLLQSKSRLHSEGLILLEIEANQGDPVMQLAKSTFPNANVQILPDYANLPRVVKIELC